MTDSINLGNATISGRTVRLSGTASQLDTEAIVQAAYDARMISAVRLETKISQNDAKVAAFADLRTLLDGLKDAVEGLRNPPGFFGRDENIFENKDAFFSSNTLTQPGELVGVSVANSASSGTFEVVVKQIATAGKLGTAATTSDAQGLADAWNGGTAFSGTISLGLDGGDSAEIALDGTMTITDLRDAINAVSDRTDVRANVIKVSDSEFRLVLSGQETGRAIQIGDVSGTATSLFGLSEIQAAQPAIIEIDGLDVTRTTNQIDDAIEGLSFSLFKAEPGTTLAMSIEPAIGVVKEKIQDFVNAYNGFRDFLDVQSQVSGDGDVGENAVLFGNQTLRGINQQLGTLIGSTTTGLAADAISTLRDIGISLDATNRLTVDETRLDNALLGDLEGVRGLFEFKFQATSGDVRVLDRSNALSDTQFTLSIVDADNDGVPESASFDGVAATIENGTIIGADGSAYEGLKIAWVGTGSTSIDVNVSQGLADRVFNYANEVLDANDGAIARETGTLEETSADYTSQIDRIEERATAERDRLIERFTAMETALSMANRMLAQIRAQTEAASGN